jgi:hypothetical protein
LDADLPTNSRTVFATWQPVGMTTPGRPDGDAPSSDELSVDDLLGAWSSPTPPGAEAIPAEPDAADAVDASRAAALGRDVVVPDRDLADS